MLTTRVFTMIALVGALATAAPGILSEAKTNCTAHCTTKDKANGFLLVEQVVVWDMHLLVCEWSKDGTTQGGNYYLDGGMAGEAYTADPIVYPPFPGQPAKMPVTCS